MTKNTYPIQSDESEIIASFNLPLDELAGLLPDAVIILNSAMQIVHMNSIAEKLFGFSLDEAAGRDLEILLPDGMDVPHQAQASNFLMEESASRRMGEDRIVYGKHQDGHLIPLDISIVQKTWNGRLYVICVPRDVSRQIAAQQELMSSEKRYQGMIESQNTLILRMGEDGRIIFANQAFCRMFGKRAEELIGNSFTPVVHPDDLPKTLEAKKALEIPPYRSIFEERVMTAAGWKWLAWENSAIMDVAGNRYEILGVGNDITDRKQVEELAFSERDLAIILAQQIGLDEALPLCLDLVLKISGMDCGGIYLVDRKQNHDLRLMAHKGLSNGFIAQSGSYEKDSDRYQLVMRGAAIYQSYLSTTIKKNANDLNEGLHSFAVIPLKSNGETIACINVASHVYDDIPEFRRQALENLAIHIGNIISRFYVQEELVVSKNELTSMFDSLQDFVFVLDDQACIIQVNQKVLASLGYTREELIGRSVLEVHPEDQRPNASRIIRGMLAGSVDFCPLTLQKKDGSQIPVETKVARGLWGNREVLIGVSRDITDRKTAEVMIREKADEIEGFFKVSIDLFCITDFGGNLLRINQAWENTFGYSLDELLGRNFLEFVHPFDRPATLAEMRNLAQGQQTLNFVNRYQCKNGSWRYIEWRSQVEGSRIYAAARDITDRKAAEDLRTLQTKQLQYRQVFEETLTSISTHFISLPSEQIHGEITNILKQIGEFEKVDRSYVFLIDQNTGRINNTNEWCAAGARSLIGRLQEMSNDHFPWMLGKLERLEEVYIPFVSDLPMEAQMERERLLAQSVQSALVVPLVTHGSLVGFLGFDSIARQREWSQDSILLIKMVGDILSNALTRKQMENDLLQSEARNRALLSAVPDLIVRLRSDGVFLDFKASSNESLLLPTDQIIGESINAIMDASMSDKAMMCIEVALLSKEIQTLEFTLKSGNSSHVFEARFKDSGEDEVTAIIRDISARARLEQMKSDFINRASHELRTPIATMLLMVNLLDGESSEEEEKEYWDVLKNELNRERILVEDLLMVGRLESDKVDLHISSFDISELLNQVARQVELPAREKQISIEMNTQRAPDEPLYLIEADEKALTQVLMNLMGNALKFTPASGSVSVNLHKKNSGYGITISDSGIGIPGEDIPLLFTRFFRGTNAIEEEIPGTGIGLFIVRSIVEKHGGEITVCSDLGKGSQFDIWLPAYAVSGGEGIFRHPLSG
jgi:PAS domain S-box-containing protein